MPRIGILNRNIDSILGSFSAISTGYLGPTVNIGIGLSLTVRHADEHRRERPVALWQVDIACHPSGVTHGVDGKF
jgi:hypothetical protein